jgi:hypothetical protein
MCSSDAVPHLGPVMSAKSKQVLRVRIADRAALKLFWPPTSRGSSASTG